MDEKGTYCPNCGKKITDDGVFCSKCGTNIHTYEPHQSNTPKNESRTGLILANVLLPGLGHIIDGKTTKGLIILFGYIFLAAIAVILALNTIGFSLLLPISLWIYGLYDISKPEGVSKNINIGFVALIFVLLICTLILFSASYNSIGKIGTNTTADGKYVVYNFSDTCSVELPKNIKFTDNVGDYSSSSNVAGSNVNIQSKSLFGNSEVSQITYSKSVVDGSTVGVNLNDGGSNTINGKTVYHRTVMSEATGESVSVMGQNKELVDYIADHVKFKDGNGTSQNTGTVQKSDNNKTTNTPGSNVQPTPTPTPEPTPEPSTSPSPTNRTAKVVKV